MVGGIRCGAWHGGVGLTLEGWSAVCAIVDIIRAMMIPLDAPKRIANTMRPVVLVMPSQTKSKMAEM
jgi:hypothetical protein